MTASIEDRLRAHFAERTARESLPGPEADTATRRLQQAGDASARRGPGPRRRSGRRSGHGSRRRLVLAAAVVVTTAAVGGALALRDDTPSRVSTGSAPSPTSTTTETSTTTSAPPPPAAGTAPTGPIVYHETVLGTWSGSAWVPWDGRTTPPGGLEYRLVQLDQPVGTAVGTVIPDLCVGVGFVEAGVDVGIDDDPGRYGAVAVAGVGEPRPRPVDVLDPSDPAYRDAASEVLAGLGVTDPDPGVRQVVRGDLDGDGETEVLVTARRGDDPDALSGGDHAIVFLRQVVDGVVETTVIGSSVPWPQDAPPIWRYEVTAIADLNGDGRMEVVIEAEDSYPGGTAVAVHELQPDGTMPEVLSGGCGN
ncbi:MAG TPA: VCBS repeat-containing protein [Acidimicrobiales bacterium]|nr:VCBS repeat-containing protein [Acidimicrobiales bacterium]